MGLCRCGQRPSPPAAIPRGYGGFRPGRLGHLGGRFDVHGLTPSGPSGTVTPLAASHPVASSSEAGFAPSQAQRIYQTVGTTLLGWLTREDAYRAIRTDPTPTIEAIRATQETSGEDLSLTSDTVVDELTSPTDDRYQFLVDILLAGLPDPDR